MKIIHYINVILFSLNVLLYVTMVPVAMLAQLILGPAQLIMALIMTVKFYKTLASSLQRLLIIYWLLALTDLICSTLTLMIGYDPDDLFSPFNIIAFPVSMCIAAYFVYVTYRINTYINPKL